MFVEDVITAITGGMDGVPARSLRSNMERAAVEFDERTAEAFARSLFGELSQNPHDLRGLESLIILGLAHPRILARHGISLETECRRLAVVLDRGGQGARAQQLLDILATNMPSPADGAPATEVVLTEEPGTAERVAAIEGLLREADQCIGRGKRKEAVKHLQEILKLDHDRFDVARMIRDLRREDENRRAHLGNAFNALKLVLALALVGALGYGVVQREQRIRERWDSLPQVGKGATPALQARLDGIQSLLAEERAWTGVFQAMRERDQLTAQIQRQQEEAARAAREAVLKEQARLQEAEDTRLRGMLHVKNAKFDEALADLRQALELGGEKWAQRPRVLADISAIEGWKAQKP